MTSTARLLIAILAAGVVSLGVALTVVIGFGLSDSNDSTSAATLSPCSGDMAMMQGMQAVMGQQASATMMSRMSTNCTDAGVACQGGGMMSGSMPAMQGMGVCTPGPGGAKTCPSAGMMMSGSDAIPCLTPTKTP